MATIKPGWWKSRSSQKLVSPQLLEWCFTKFSMLALEPLHNNFYPFTDSSSSFTILTFKPKFLKVEDCVPDQESFFGLLCFYFILMDNIRKFSRAYFSTVMGRWESPTWFLCNLNFRAIFSHLTHTEKKGAKIQITE